MANESDKPQGADGAGAAAGGGPQAGAGEPAAPQQAPLTVRAQYIKDLSFENPGAPQSLAEMQGAPNVDISVNVNAQRLADETFEVALSIAGTAKQDDKTVFVVELVYAGVFTLSGVSAEHREPLILIECPRLLFPFARNIVADVSRDGGFPPLLLQPFDFVALYQQHVQQRQAQGQDQPGAPGASEPPAGGGGPGTES